MEITSDSTWLGESTRESIRVELEATRAAFHVLLASVPETQWRRPSANPAWTIGELLFHMTVALRFLPADIALIRRARWMPRPPAVIFNWLNVLYARWGARRAERASLARLYDEVHARAVAILGSMRDDEWDRGVTYPGWDSYLNGFVTIEKLFRYVTHHFESHAAEIRQLLKDV
jgi:hypothetical protein